MDGARTQKAHVCVPWVLLLLLAGNAFGSAQSRSTLRLSEYQKQDWQVEDGLPENNVRMITQRNDGQLLLATSSGLTSFDGLQFHDLPFSGLPEGEAVDAVLQGENGDVWIGTDGHGVLHMRDGVVENISETAGRMNERIRALHLDASNTLWIATQNGIERYRDGKLKTYEEAGMISGDVISAFAEDGRGGMFFVTSEGLFTVQGEDAPRPYVLRDRSLGQIVAVYSDSKGRIWIGAMKGLVQLVTRAGDPRYEELVAARLKSPVTVIISGADNELWVGTRHNGLWRLGADGISSWTSHEGLPDDSIRSLCVDREKNLWIGMLTGGLSRWRLGDFAPYGEPEGFPSTYAANAFADSHGGLWLGTWGRGVYRLHGKTLTENTPPGMPPATPIRAIAEDIHGDVWVGTWFDGIYRWKGAAYRHYLLGIESPGNAVSSILADHEGGLWVGTYTGLFYFQDGEPAVTPRALMLGSKLVTCMVEEANGIVLVGTSTGLFRIRDGEVKSVQDLPHPYVLSLTKDKQGHVWVGTKASMLSLLQGDHAKVFPEGAGLPKLQVNTAVEDANGSLWLGTPRGVMRVAAADLLASMEGSRKSFGVRVFGQHDGLRSSEVGGASTPGSTIASDGSIWFATTKGYVHTTLPESKPGLPPTISMLGWSLNDDTDSTHAAQGAHVALPAEQADVIFFFNAINLSNPGRLEFRYRLTGYDTDWTSTHGRYAHYRRIARGKYVFEVQVRNGGEAWNDTVVSLPVQQSGHFYESYYFYLAMLLLVTGVGVLFFRQRVQLVKGRIGVVIEERGRIARECHDTLMAGFAAISWQLEATAKLFRDKDASASAPAQSLELARSMVSHCQAEARRIIWDLRDSDQITTILSEALSRTLSAAHPKDAIAVSFGVEGEEVPLAPAYVHHLVCISQEAVSNAMRHASPTQINVQLRFKADSLNLIIRDDGCGIHGETSKVGHFGIPVMEERARKVGGVFRVESTRDEGTEISVSVSFKAMQAGGRHQPNVVRWIGI